MWILAFITGAAAQTVSPLPANLSEAEVDAEHAISGCKVVRDCGLDANQLGAAFLIRAAAAAVLRGELDLQSVANGMYLADGTYRAWKAIIPDADEVSPEEWVVKWDGAPEPVTLTAPPPPETSTTDTTDTTVRKAPQNATFAISAGVTPVFNDPFLAEVPFRITAEVAANDWVVLELAGGGVPFTKVSPLTQQIINENQVTPDVSRMTWHVHGAMRVNPLVGTLGAHTVRLGAYVGLGAVGTKDDLRFSQAVGNPAAEETEVQAHPAAVVGLLAEVGGNHLRFRARLHSQTHVETYESTVLEMKSAMMFGPEVAWAF